MKVEQDTTHSPAGYQQRRERGRAARRAVPRGAHAGWAPAPDRPDPVDPPGGAGEGTARGTNADPVRAHDGFTVYVHAGVCRRHGQRPRDDA